MQPNNANNSISIDDRATCAVMGALIADALALSYLIFASTADPTNEEFRRVWWLNSQW